MNRYCLYILYFIFCSSTVSAQKGVELGAWLGFSHYYGDLQTELTISDLGLAGGLNFRYNLDERIAVKTSLNLGRLSGSDEDSQNSFERNRNLSFSSNVWDLTTQIEFNFLPYIHGSDGEYFTPYLLAGLSAFSYSPKAKLDDQTFNLRDFGTEGQPIGEEYGRFSLAPTIGFGLKWDINSDWSFNVELTIHNSATDYIDDVSGVYPDLNELRTVRGLQAVSLSDRSIGDGIGEAGRQRGNSKNNDLYTFLGLSIMRYFGTLNCPRVTKKRVKL